MGISELVEALEARGEATFLVFKRDCCFPPFFIELGVVVNGKLWWEYLFFKYVGRK